VLFFIPESEAGVNMPLRTQTEAPRTGVTETQMRSASETPPRANPDAPLKGVRTNIVQSIRAFRVQDLQDAAQNLGHHFLYANLANAQTKQDVLDLIAQQFTLPLHVGKNFDALYDSVTDPLHKSGPQPGFIAVLEHIPANGKFDKEAREQLLDIFRDAADYWGDRKIPFRCFYSFL
jgi:RNAse (barnase) inhibitor barstar